MWRWFSTRDAAHRPLSVVRVGVRRNEAPRRRVELAGEVVGAALATDRPSPKLVVELDLGFPLGVRRRLPGPLSTRRVAPTSPPGARAGVMKTVESPATREMGAVNAAARRRTARRTFKRNDLPPTTRRRSNRNSRKGADCRLLDEWGDRKPALTDEPGAAKHGFREALGRFSRRPTTNASPARATSRRPPITSWRRADRDRESARNQSRLPMTFGLCAFHSGIGGSVRSATTKTVSPRRGVLLLEMSREALPRGAEKRSRIHVAFRTASPGGIFHRSTASKLTTDRRG
jgi:hypothetical protein